MGKVLLDSNTYSAFFKGDRNVIEEIENSDIVYLSVIVMGELVSAFKKGSFYSKNNEGLSNFLRKSNVEVLKIGRETANIYGNIRFLLERKGKPISPNDIWIAASAIETGSILLTYDTDFLQVDGLRVWDILNKN